MSHPSPVHPSDPLDLESFDSAVDSLDKVIGKILEDLQALNDEIHNSQCPAGSCRSLAKRLVARASLFSDKVDGLFDLVEDLFDKPTKSDDEFVCPDDEVEAELDPDYTEGSAEETESEGTEVLEDDEVVEEELIE